MTPWEKYLQDKQGEEREYIEQKCNAVVNSDAKNLASIYIQQGKETCINEMNKILKERKLTTIEAVMLSGKVREILVENNIFLKEKQAALKK